MTHFNDHRGRDLTHSRNFKRYCLKGQAKTPGFSAVVQDAFFRGARKRTAANPYPKGKRHDAFAEGQRRGLDVF